MKRFITSENHNPNYLATICKVGELFPIEGADRLRRVVINGNDMVVPTTMNTGDIVVYFPIESSICAGYLSANNLYELGEWERNSNSEIVGNLIEAINLAKTEGRKDDAANFTAEAKALVGFFNKRGRVRLLTLRGCPSKGFVASVQSLVNWKPELADVDWESLVGTSFNYIGEDEICRKYIPPMPEERQRTPKGENYFYKKRMKKLVKFNRLVDGQFNFHYDTKHLEEHMAIFNPNDVITISLKVHGTSHISSNILTNKKSEFSKPFCKKRIKKILNMRYNRFSHAQKKYLTNAYVVSMTKPIKEYGNVYSSRGVIKNKYINEGAQNFYSVDVYGHVNNIIMPYLSKGMTVYGETVGYLPGSEKMIQKDHDYGCEVGKCKFMPYRITETDVYGNVKEWNLMDVDKWTHDLVDSHPELTEHIMFLTIFYHGPFKDLYPEISTTEHWHENVLAAMKVDSERFGMELKEPLCHLHEREAIEAKALLEDAINTKKPKMVIKKLKNNYENLEARRAPREGLVIRIDDDPKSEAWKLKTYAHYHREAIQHDTDEYDIEEFESMGSDE